MDYYTETASGYNELHGEEQRRKLALIKELVIPKKADLLLDVGCGTGISSDFDCMVIGIDPSSGLLGQNKNSFLILGKGEALPFKDSCFDFVLSLTSLHNFDDIEKGISEMKRVGKSDIIISVLKKAQQFDLIEKLLHHYFVVTKTVNDEHDCIFFCKTNS